MAGLSRDAHTRSFAKAVSRRLTGRIDTFLLSWIITGSVRFASGIAGTELVTKIVLYYLHERAWASFPGVARRDTGQWRAENLRFGNPDRRCSASKEATCRPAKTIFS